MKNTTTQRAAIRCALAAFDRKANDLLLTCSDDAIVQRAWLIKVTLKRAVSMCQSDAHRARMIADATAALGKPWPSQEAA